MNEEKAIRLWLDIGGINELYVDELEDEATSIAAKFKTRRRVKYGALAAAAASLSAAVAIMLIRPRLATKQLTRLGGVRRTA